MEALSKDEQEQHAWRRWEAALARIRERRAPQERGRRREDALWLSMHGLSALALCFCAGWAAHRDGLLSPYVATSAIVLLCTLGLCAVRLALISSSDQRPEQP